MSAIEKPDPAVITDSLINDDQQTQYVDLTPTWSGVVPLLVAGIRSSDANSSALMVEVYRMAALADIANSWISRFKAQGDILATGATIANHRAWVKFRTEFEDEFQKMSDRMKRMEKEVFG